MENGHQLNWIKVNRGFLPEERQWLDKLLSKHFKNKEVLLKQLESAKVVAYCPCGCRSIKICIAKDVPPYPYATRVPVEMMALDTDGIPIVFYLHVINGYIDELEVFRADSLSIQQDKIDITNATIIPISQ